MEVSPAESRVPHLDDDIVRGGDLGNGQILQAELASLGVTLQSFHLPALNTSSYWCVVVRVSQLTNINIKLEF